MQIPKKIKIGGFRYSVVTCEDEDKRLPKDAAGIFDPEKGYIALRKGYLPWMLETLIHEVMHAVNSEIEEEKIEFLAQALYQVIADNPLVFAPSIQAKPKRKKAGVANGRRK